jgi:LuxR family maltose regulon positive regulatory protein
MAKVRKQPASTDAKPQAIAKISPPRLPAVYSRSRLLEQLNIALQYPLVWISAPGGYGKTTLIADYLHAQGLPCLWYQIDAGDADIASFFHYMGLAAKHLAPKVRRPMPVYTSEYFGGLPTFARRFFEELASRLPESTVLVFDNYQELPADAALHEIIHNGLKQLPRGVNVVVLSRQPPPPAYAVDRANALMSLIGEDALRFTPEESNGVAALRLRDITPLHKPVIAQLHERSHGWAAGLILMLEQVQSQATPDATVQSITPDTVYEYFDHELFRHIPDEIRNLLLHTAYLPTVSPAAAQTLTGSDRTAILLAELNRNNFFTQRHAGASPVYQYHPLLREFLHIQAQTFFTESQRRALVCSSAQILANEERIDAAGYLLLNMHEDEALARLSIQHAPMLLASGMHQTLAEWIAALPEEVRTQDPWLLYWWGNCRMPFNPTHSYALFTQAFELFKSRKDVAGIYLAWAAAVEANAMGWIDFSLLGPWIEKFYESEAAYPIPPVPEIQARVTLGMFMACMHGQPSSPDMQVWENRLLQLLEQTPVPELRLMMGCHLHWYYEIWLLDKPKAAMTRELLRPRVPLSRLPAIAQLLWQLIEIDILNAYENLNRCIADNQRVRLKMREYGIGIFEHFAYTQEIYVALWLGDHTAAKQTLEELWQNFQLHPAREFGLGHYYYLTGWEAFLRNDLDTAIAQFEACKRVADRFGGPQQHMGTDIALAQALLMREDYARVDALLARIDKIGISTVNLFAYFIVLLVKAMRAFLANDEAAGHTFLKQATVLGQQNDFTHHLWVPIHTKFIAYLCGRALEAGIEAEYVTRLIRLRHLTPDPSLRQIDQWPWPIKIYALGPWRIEKDGAVLAASGKGQRRPLDLLMALIALGGKDVKESRLTELVWPDADGDAAYAAFKTTLSRLRKLLGEDAILFNDGRLSLNSACVWLDVWAFEASLHTGRAANDVSAQPEQALNLYQGHFLAEEPEQFWMLALRERLRAAFLEGLRTLAQSLRDKNRFTDAVQWYERGLTVDGLIEEFYQGLMACHLQAGQRSDALRVYERCRRILQQTFNIEPSAATRALYNQAKEPPP